MPGMLTALSQVGLIKIAITPNPFGQTARFEQKLDLQNGEIYLLGHADGKALRMVISVDANERHRYRLPERFSAEPGGRDCDLAR